MDIKKQIMTMSMLLCLGLSFSIFAQAGRTIKVGKTGTVDYNTITAAINAANPGDIIKIMDAETYAEQVSIDSTKCPLTLISNDPTSPNKPIIKFQDKTNVHPKTYKESQADSTINFDKNGALRIVGARNVIIDGIAVDGGGDYVYFYDAIWNQSNPLLYGNCAISLWHCGQVIIRNCDVSNAYFGIQVKDRNLGGVFANPNPADIDTINNVPLSAFGQQGNHLIERNRIHNNSFGIYSESQWDIGSTVRYNLIYENHHTSSVLTTMKAFASEWSNQPGGAFFFKDVPLSPMAIYNNTFYKNLMIFAGHWQAGYQHLIFNNIIGPPSTYWNTFQPASGMSISMELTPAMTNRIYNCVFAAQVVPPQTSNTRIMDQLPQLQGAGGAAPNPGDLIPAGTVGQPGFPAASDVRWLEMDSSMFKSINPASDNFLEPNWDDDNVKTYISHKGWEASGVTNTDGSRADLGAIEQAHGKPSFVGTIQPLEPIKIIGKTTNQVRIRFSLDARENTTMTNPVIKLFRLVRIKYKKDTFGPDHITDIGISAADMTTIPVPATPVKVGDNTYTLNINLSNQSYAFIEMIIEATGADGNKFTTSVGFLPYRQLDYQFLVEVLNKADKVIDTVRVGDTVKLRLTPQKADGTSFTGTIKPVAVTLSSTGGKPILTPGPTDLINLTYPSGVTGVDVKPVVFTNVPPAGNSENISASGTWANPSTGTLLPFLGVGSIVVLSGPPEKVVFHNPPSDSFKPPPAHPVLPAGFAYPCTLYVYDKYGNQVNSPAQVSVKSIMPDLANVIGGHPDTIITTDALGIGTFKVMTTVTAQKDAIVTFSGNVPGKTYTDYASMIIGERAEHLVIFYSDTMGLDPNVELRGQVGDKLQIIVIATKTKDNPKVTDVFDFPAKFTISGTNPAMKFYSSPTATTPTNSFTLTNGRVTLWVSSTDSLNNAGVSMTSDNIIADDTRNKIYFTRPLISIDSAFYYANNGFGKVDSVEIYLRDTISLVSDSIWLFWPNKVDASKKSIAASAMKFAANKKQITISLASNPFPEATTSGSSSDKLGETFNKPNNNPDVKEDSSKFSIVDRVGPLLMTATVVERVSAGPGIDTFYVTFSEDVSMSTLTGEGLILLKNSVPSNLTITKADTANGRIRLIVSSATVKPEYGDSLRINPAGPVTDLLGNHAHPLNRPVPLFVKTVPANILSAAYFDKENGIADGVVDLVTIKFDKNVIIADLDITLEWTGTGGSNKAEHIDKSLISFASGDNSKINIAVKGKFNGLAENAIRTDGPMVANVHYISLEDSRSGTVLDSAAPVLVDSAIYKPGRRPANSVLHDPDTLYVTFSEPLSSIEKTNSTPFLSWRGQVSNAYLLNLVTPYTLIPESGTRTTYKFIVSSFTVNPPDSNFFPRTNDSLRINSTAFVTGADTIIQKNPVNRSIPLIVMPIPYDITVLITNSPVKLSESGKNIMEVVVKPDIKTIAQVDLKVTGYIFDALGNNLHNIDTTFDKTGNIAELRVKWDCKNKINKLVGTGVYLLSLNVWKDGAKYGNTIYKKIGVKR